MDKRTDVVANSHKFKTKWSFPHLMHSNTRGNHRAISYMFTTLRTTFVSQFWHHSDAKCSYFCSHEQLMWACMPSISFRVLNFLHIPTLPSFQSLKYSLLFATDKNKAFWKISDITKMIKYHPYHHHQRNRNELSTPLSALNY